MDENDLGYRTASEFTKLYYESMDRKRHLMSRYYMDNAALVWNGNGRNGADEIQKFLASLPISTHLLTSQDVQRIPDGAVGNKMAYVIQTAGNVKFQGRPSKQMFYQTFAITNEGDKWKIVSDCFRFQEHVATT
uniref:NTF2-related export protein n=1 Tax=Cuerna arida TaxID=1464854 RepID=A0A1B6EI12_9HEMI